MNRSKMKRPYYISFIAMIVFIGAYLCLQHFNPEKASETVITILTIIAGVAIWLEYIEKKYHKERIRTYDFIR